MSCRATLSSVVAESLSESNEIKATTWVWHWRYPGRGTGLNHRTCGVRGFGAGASAPDPSLPDLRPGQMLTWHGPSHPSLPHACSPWQLLHRSPRCSAERAPALSVQLGANASCAWRRVAMASMTMGHVTRCSSLPQQLRKEAASTLQRKDSVGITRVAATKAVAPVASWSSNESPAIDAVQKGVEKALKGLVAAAATAVVALAPAAGPALADPEFTLYYGTAASASSYGGYGGNASKKDSAEYVYEVPEDWKERAISKVEKGTNGTDSEFYNPKKRTEKTYTLFLAGFRRLPLKDDVLNNIALSDVDLQDLLQSADSNVFTEKEIDGQKYYDFDIDSPIGHALITVTSAKNKLYAHFVNAKPAEWERDQAVLRRIHDSFKTVGRDPLGQ